MYISKYIPKGLSRTDLVEVILHDPVFTDDIPPRACTIRSKGFRSAEKWDWKYIPGSRNTIIWYRKQNNVTWIPWKGFSQEKYDNQQFGLTPEELPI